METATKLTGEERQRFMAEFARKHPPETIVATLRQVKAEMAVETETRESFGITKKMTMTPAASKLAAAGYSYLGYLIDRFIIEEPRKGMGRRVPYKPGVHLASDALAELKEFFEKKDEAGKNRIFLVLNGKQDDTPRCIGFTLAESALARLSK